jgi:hypothetical protein
MKSHLTNSLTVYTSLFAILAIICWWKNGHDGTHFDIRQLIDIYTFVATQLTAKYGLDSLLNSDKGKKPE